MLGYLPRAIKVNKKTYKIRTDYRDILRIVSAFAAKDLTDREKIYICLKQIYIDLDSIPAEDIAEAYSAAVAFMDCNMHHDKPGPKLINWVKDEPLIFPAVNKVAGFEVRSVEYMHWWTFIGYFQGIDNNDTWGFILTIRQKLAKNRQLEKHEKAFYNANRKLCIVEEPKNRRKETEKALIDIFNDLKKEAGNNGRRSK